MTLLHNTLSGREQALIQTAQPGRDHGRQAQVLPTRGNLLGPPPEGFPLDNRLRSNHHILGMSPDSRQRIARDQTGTKLTSRYVKLQKTRFLAIWLMIKKNRILGDCHNPTISTKHWFPKALKMNYPWVENVQIMAEQFQK
ncbi:hypothetical protein [uncultured Tateyamaria sp.]|uniref:hypothetical protein n=1 Tax=uncultured Tateyamaria sp. TaxID=455651 RepID=UPI0026096FEA|nr:hypothetical protein [uncultured Tateyamaria sp.]